MQKISSVLKFSIREFLPEVISVIGVEVMRKDGFARNLIKHYLINSIETTRK